MFQAANFQQQIIRTAAFSASHWPAWTCLHLDAITAQI